MEAELRQLLGVQLKDAYSAEKQALRCMERSLRRVSSDELRQAIQTHIEETRGQIERVESCLEQVNLRPGRYKCVAMQGLVEEAEHEAENQEAKGAVLDLVLIAGQQRIEHYEIAAYGTAAALADALKEDKIAEMLRQTLEEEKRTDELLTVVTQQTILPAALQAE